MNLIQFQSNILGVLAKTKSSDKKKKELLFEMFRTKMTGQNLMYKIKQIKTSTP